MKTRKWMIVVIAALGSWLPAFSMAWPSETGYSTEADLNAAEETIDPNLNGSQDRRQRRKAALRAARVKRRHEIRQIQIARETAAADQRARDPASVSDIKVAFKIDPRLTRSLYMGDRWISSSTFAGTIGQDTVEAKVRGIGPKGTDVPIHPEWIAEDKEMLAVTPSQGDTVQIKVNQPGESTVQITSLGFSKKLRIKATSQGSAMQVEIIQ